jgi:hypothetical protein
MIFCRISPAAMRVSLIVAEPAPGWPPPPNRCRMVLTLISGAAATDDKIAATLVDKDHEHRISIDDLAVQLHHHRQFDVFVDIDHADTDPLALDLVLLSITHQAEQHLFLHLAVGHVEKIDRDIEVRPLFEEKRGGPGILGGGGTEGQLAGILVEPEQKQGGLQGGELQALPLNFPNQQGDGGPDFFDALPVGLRSPMPM